MEERDKDDNHGGEKDDGDADGDGESCAKHWNLKLLATVPRAAC